MRKIYFVAFIAIGLGFGAWESIGPYGGYVRTMAASHTNDNIAYVASNNYPAIVAKTTDGGGMYRWNIMVGVKEHKAGIANPRLVVQPNPARGRVQFSYSLNMSGPVNPFSLP